MPKKVDVRTKGIHVKLEKEVHLQFKVRLIYLGLTMQEAFAEFARLVSEGSPSMTNVLNRLVREQAKQELASVGLTPLPYSKTRRLNELDPESLYDLINEGDSDVDQQRAGVAGAGDEVL